MVLVFACGTFPLSTEMARVAGEVPWPALVLFLGSQVAVTALAARMVVADYETQECPGQWNRTEGYEPAESSSDFKPRPRLLAEPAPRGLDAALRFKDRATGTVGHFGAFIVGHLLIGMGFMRPEHGWATLLGVLVIWRSRVVDVSPRLHLLGVEFEEQHRQNLRRTLMDIVLFVGPACAIWGTLFGWERPGGPYRPVARARWVQLGPAIRTYPKSPHVAGVT